MEITNEKTENKKRLERQKIFGDNLERRRKVRNVSRRDLALAIGVTEQVMSTYCTGRRSPSLDKIYNLAEFLDCSTDDLIGKTTAQEAHDMTEYRMARAVAIANTAGLMVSKQGSVIILNTIADRQISGDKDEVVLAPSIVLKFSDEKNFIDCIDGTLFHSLRAGQDFLTTFKQLYSTLIF